MKVYWSYKSIPELKNLEPDVASQFWNNGCYQASLHWKVRGSLLLGTVIAGLSGVLGLTLQDKFDFDTIVGLKYFTGTVGVFIGSLIGGLVYNQTLVSHARSYMQKHNQAYKED